MGLSLHSTHARPLNASGCTRYDAEALLQAQRASEYFCQRLTGVWIQKVRDTGSIILAHGERSAEAVCVLRDYLQKAKH